MDNNYLEIFRLFVPANKVIGSNTGQNYKTIMGKSNWLATQARNIIDGSLQVFDFQMPDKDKILEITQGRTFSLCTEMWLGTNRIFDLYNYGTTFKAIIDVFTSNGYWQDDNYNCIWPILVSGGGRDSWQERAIRYEGDGLPDDISFSLFKNISGNGGNFLIRIFIK